MTNLNLAQAYLTKATVRLDVLDLLISKKAYSDVIRESQEAVELALKGMLRAVGVEPPKIHDVGKLIIAHSDKFPDGVRDKAEQIATISKQLRKERELSFYGDIDYVPTEEYSEEDAVEAVKNTRFVVDLATSVIS